MTLKTKNSKPKTISVIAGGSGTSAVLRGLKGKYQLNAIVSMTDSGGSSGVLRDELGILPPGDLRLCLLALSNDTKTLCDLFGYRFHEGGLRGHNLGNLIIAGLEKMRGNLATALKELHELLRVEDKVIPCTFDKSHLIATLKDKTTIKGEGIIYESNFSQNPVVSLALSPEAHINSEARAAIMRSDLIIIGPGDIYCSIIPNLLVKGVKEALRASKTKKILMANLINKRRQVDDFTISDYVCILEQYAYQGMLDMVIYNTDVPSPILLKKLPREGTPLPLPSKKELASSRPVLKGYDLLAQIPTKKEKGDVLHRPLIHHDPQKIAHAIKKIFHE